MKMYSIKKGTRSIVFRGEGPGITGKGLIRYDDGTPFTTTKDLDFFDTVVDPIRLHNMKAGEMLSIAGIFIQLAEVGYAIFRDEDRPEYLLAVDYDEVRVQ